MTDKHIHREICSDSFEYGNHTIEVTINLRHTNQYTSIDHDVMNGVTGYHYYRFVHVQAVNDAGSREVTNTTSAAVDVEQSDHWLFGKIGADVPSIPDHVEYTVRPVLEDLDELYQYTTTETEVDIEVAMHQVEHEMSWVEVDDEVDRISKEIDELVEGVE